MKYKVGDKVRVRSDLKENTRYGGEIFARDMAEYLGKTVEITKVLDDVYCIKGTEREWRWTDEMFEPVEEELTAEEAIKVLADMCTRECKNCELGKLVKESRYSFCSGYRRAYPDKVVEILKQWKKDHEKKPIETENVMYIVVMDEKRNVVYEEKTNEAIITTTTKEETLKKYCTEHDGKYYAISERRCVVKE